ncbi:MAG: hypothetical protein EBU12_10395 [Microbacteriaceae bacterium]|nr:hypothetical protein [Microbacteriaceae bacterium]
MAYLGLSPEPSQTEQCVYFCEWKAARDAARARGDAILTMEIVDRPPECTCSDEDAQPTSIYRMTPQEIERYVKSSQGASGSGYWLMVAAIAALLLMYR